MAIADLGLLGSGSATTAGATLVITNTTGAVIPAGTLIHISGTWDNINSAAAPTITCSTVGGGTATANHATAVGQGVTTTAGQGVWHQCFRVLTTASIASGATIATLTSNQSAIKRIGHARGFSGATDTLRGTVATGGNTTGSPSVATAGTALVAGDVVIGSVSNENNAQMTADADTLNGSWSTIVGLNTTGGAGSTNVNTGSQSKIVTATGVQTYNPTNGVQDTLACVYSLQPVPEPAITQAAYRWFDEGTESGAVALANQDTAVPGDITNGDATGTLRIRLQETGSGAVPASTDFQLQWEKNLSGSWANVSIGGTPTLADTYPSSNYTGAGIALVSGTARGQSFLGDGKRLARASFYLNKSVVSGNPTGTVSAALYAHTGTYGSGTGTGSALATSTTVVDATTLPSSAGPGWVSFDFDPTYVLGSGVPYVIVVTATLTGGGIDLAVDSTVPTHSGAHVLLSGTWSTDTTRDQIFEVYTSAPATTVVPYDSPNLTNGQATTNRLTGGTGTFVAGKVSEDALMDDLGWGVGNRTELVYALKIFAADVVNADTLRFRVLKNGATTGMTYTVVPTINIIQSAVTRQATVSLTATSFLSVTGTIPQPKIETLVDSFDTTVDKTTKWSASSAQVVWDAGRAKIPNTNLYYTLSTPLAGSYDLTGSSVMAQLTLPPVVSNRETFMEILRGGATNDKLSLYVSGTDLVAGRTIGGTPTTLATTTYNATTHAWWRIRETAGTVYFDYSANGTSWNNLGSTAVPWDISKVFLGINTGYYGTNPGAADAYVDNVNVVPVGGTTQATVALTAVSTLTPTPAGLAKIETLVDSFDSSLSAQWSTWNVFTAWEAPGRVRLAPPQGITIYTGMERTDRYALRDSKVFLELVDAGNQALGSWEAVPLVLVNEAQTAHVQFHVTNGNLYAHVTTVGLVWWGPYVPATHRWLQIRETAGTVYFETSTNGTTWTERGSLPTNTLPAAFDPDRVVLLSTAGTASSEATGTAMLIDNLNTVPAGVTVSASAALSATSTLTATAVRQPQASVSLVAASTLIATAVRAPQAAVSLTAVSALTVTAVRQPQAAVALTAVSTLTTTGVRARVATVALSAVSTLTVTGSAVPAAVPLADLTSDFTSPAWAPWGSTISVTPTRLTLPGGEEQGIDTTGSEYTAVDSRFFAKVAQLPTTGVAYMYVSASPVDVFSYFGFAFGDGNLVVEDLDGTVTTVAWDPAKPFLSLHYVTDTLYWERSATGGSGTWETVASGSHPIAKVSRLYAGFSISDVSTGEAWIESVNIPEVANLAPNPSFEIDLSEWVNASGTAPDLDRVDTEAHHGSWSMLVTSNNVSAANTILRTPSSSGLLIPVTPGEPVSMGVHGRWLTGTPKVLRIDVRWMTNATTESATQPGTGDPATMTTSGWVQSVEEGVIAPADALGVRARVVCPMTVLGDAFYVDALQIVKAATLPPYDSGPPVVAVTAALSATSTLTTAGVREAQAAASLTATSTLTVAAVRQPQAAVSLVATSTLTATAVREPQAAASLTATSTLTVVAVRQPQASVALSAVSALVATAVRVVLPTVSLTAASTLSTAAVRVPQGAAALTATSTLSATALRAPQAAVSLTAVSTLTATAVRFGVPQAAVSLVASSTLTATAVREPQASVSLVTASTLTATAVRFGVAQAAVPLTAASTLTAAAIREPQAAASLVATSALTVTAVRFGVAQAAVSLVAASTLTATAVREPQAAASLTAISTLTATAVRFGVLEAAVPLTATSTLTATAVREPQAAAALVATSTLMVTAVRQPQASVSLTAISTLTVAATTTPAVFGTAALTATSTLTATAVRQPQGAASLVAISTLTPFALGVTVVLATAPLTATSTLTTAGVREPQAAVSLAASSTLTATAVRQPQAAVALTAASVLTATAVRFGVTQAAVPLVAASILTATAVRQPQAAVSLTAASVLTVAADRIVPAQATVALTAASTLTATAVRQPQAAVSLTATSTLTPLAVGVAIVPATASLSATSTLTTDGVRQPEASVALTAISTLTTVAVRQPQASVPLTATSTLTVSGTTVPATPVVAVTVALTATSTLSATGARVASVALTATATLTTAGTTVTAATVTLTATSTLSATGIGGVVAHVGVSVVVGGVEKVVVSRWVVVGGVKKSVMDASVIVGGTKKPVA